MTNQRYTTDLIVTAQDFETCGWKDVLNQTSREGYPAMWQTFSAAACKAIEEGKSEHGKVLWLLADACSMMLSPLSPNEPFRPFAVLNNYRSVIIDDLADADIAFFAAIVETVDDVWLKSRLADLVWLRGKPRTVTFALTAIDAYRAIPLDPETWICGGQECWQRAANLTRALRASAGDRLEQMEASMLAVFSMATREMGFFGLWLAELLNSNGLAWANRSGIARKLETLAKEFNSEGDLHRAREYFSASAVWYKTIPDNAKAAEATVSLAEDWVKEAIARVSTANPSHMAASGFYENAIQVYRTIPRTERAAYKVDERIAELRTRLTDSGQKTLSEMTRMSTPGIDITEIVEIARGFVAGKPAAAALLAFANLHRGAKVDKLRKNALKRLQQFPLQSMFASTMVSRDGRVIAKRPSSRFGRELTQDDEIALRAEMIRDYGFLVGIVVQGHILPALDVLLLEHRLREADFVGLAKQCPIVPKLRAGIFGKALFAGYEKDFVSALHLLIPQIEHTVRVHLKEAGAKTTNLDKDGIENENGMNTLLDLPEAEQVFGKDLAFELKSLFCDAFGPNLRNEFAHGLLDEDACHSQYAIYSWWLALRLVFNTWWNAAHKDSGEDDEEPAIG